MLITVGIGEYAVSGCAEDELVTYSLGSCLGLAVYDPVARIGGMMHCMLPLSKHSKEKASLNPALFTDLGVPLLLRSLLEQGAAKDRLLVKAAGCAASMQEDTMFEIGKKNFMVFRKVMWTNGLLIASKDVGGTVARTMYLRIRDGHTRIKSEGTERNI